MQPTDALVLPPSLQLFEQGRISSPRVRDPRSLFGYWEQRDG